MSALPQDIPAIDPRERFLDVAWSIGMRLCRDAIFDGKRCNWLGDSMEPHGGEWKVAHKSFGPELYAGTSGIALFLARLHRLRPDPVLADTARAAMRQSLSQIDEFPAEARHTLHSGWVGIALVLLDLAEILGDKSYESEARRLLDGIRGLPLDPLMLDVIGGSAGTIAALCAIDRKFGGDRYLDEVIRHGEHLLAQAHRHGRDARSSNEEAWSWTTLPPMGPGEEKDLCGYSHGAAGVAVAMLELYARTGEARWLEAARGGFAYERQYFSPEQQNWPDFRSFSSPNPSQPGYSMAWCHGAPGIALSRLRAYALTKDETYKKEAEAGLAGTYRAIAMPTQGDNYCLCHGLGGNVEGFIIAADVLPDERYRSVADLVGDRGIQTVHHPRSPWPCGVMGGGETPNLMIGTAGIGHFYLRLYDSRATPSILLVS